MGGAFGENITLDTGAHATLRIIARALRRRHGSCSGGTFLGTCWTRTSSCGIHIEST
jgi:hypothetical protein